MTSMATRKDDPIISSGQEIANIFYRYDHYHDNLQYYVPNIYMDDLIVYKFVKEYNGLSQKAAVKDNCFAEGNFII